MSHLSGASGEKKASSHSDQWQAGAAEFGVAFADPEAARGLGHWDAALRKYDTRPGKPTING